MAGEAAGAGLTAAGNINAGECGSLRRRSRLSDREPVCGGAGRIGRRQRKAGRHGKICQESSRRQRCRISDRSQRSDDAGSQPGEGSVAGIRGRLPGERCSAGTAERRRRDQLGAGDQGRDVLGGDGGAGVEV